MPRYNVALLSLLLLPAACSGSSGGGGGPGTSQGALRQLAEQYPSLSAADVKARLDALSVEEHFVLDLVGKQFKPAVFRRACEVDPNIGWSYFTDQTTSNCSQAQQQWQDYVQWHQASYGPGADVNENAELGRGDIVIYYQCKSGEIDPGSCSLYNQVKSQIADGTAQTSQTIINNIGTTCEIGVDPNCYP